MENKKKPSEGAKPAREASFANSHGIDWENRPGVPKCPECGFGKGVSLYTKEWRIVDGKEVCPWQCENCSIIWYESSSVPGKDEQTSTPKSEPVSVQPPLSGKIRESGSPAERISGSDGSITRSTESPDEGASLQSVEIRAGLEGAGREAKK